MNTYKTILFSTLLFVTGIFSTNVANTIHASEYDNIKVYMCPIPNEYKKDRKTLRTLSVPLMKLSYVDFTKYEKVARMLKKQDIDLTSLSTNNLVAKLSSFESDIVIFPTIGFYTNVNVEVLDIVEAEAVVDESIADESIIDTLDENAIDKTTYIIDDDTSIDVNTIEESSTESAIDTIDNADESVIDKLERSIIDEPLIDDNINIIDDIDANTLEIINSITNIDFINYKNSLEN